MKIHTLTQACSDLALHFGEGDESSKKKPMVCDMKYEQLVLISLTV